MGARPLKRAVDQYVVAPLAAMIVEKRFPAGDQFLFVRSDGEGIQVEFIDPDADDTKPPQRPLNVEPRPVADDKSIKYDYDIVYVRAPRFVKTRAGKDQPAVVWPDAHHPTKMRVGGVDLMILHPDGSEEVLVAGGKGAVAGESHRGAEQV